MKWRILQFILCMAVAGPLVAGTDWNRRVWRSDDGLLDNRVIGVGQSSDGFVWVATVRGVMRFDGMEFNVLPGTAEFASARKLLTQFIDSQDRIWIAQESGEILCLARGEIVMKIPPPVQGGRFAFLSIIEEKAGRILFCFPDGRFFSVENGKVTSVRSEDIPGTGNSCLVKDGRGQVWFSKGDGCGIFKDDCLVQLETIRVEQMAGAVSGGVWICSDNELWRATELGSVERVCSIPEDFGGVQVKALHEDRRGGLWFGTDGAGLFYFNGDTFEKVPCSSLDIRSLSEDRDGKIWVGTGEGVNLLEPAVVKFLRATKDKSYQNVLSIAQEKDGLFWLVWSSGLVSKSLSTDLWNVSASGDWVFPGADLILKAQCVVPDPSGGVWFGTEFSGLCGWGVEGVKSKWGTEDGLAGDEVTALHMTPTGDLWMGIQSVNDEEFFLQCLTAGTLKSYPLPPGSLGVVAFASDGDGQTWFATYDGRVFRVNHEGVMVEQTEVFAANRCSILSLCATPDKSLWIGFTGQGLGRLKNGRFSRYKTEQGLHENFISRILFDGKESLWLSGNRGIVRIRLADFDEIDQGNSLLVQSVGYDKFFGLPSFQSTEYFWPGAILDSQGRLLFGMKGGLAVVRPEDPTERQTAWPVIIRQVNVDGQTIAEHCYDKTFRETERSRVFELAGQTNIQLRIPPGAGNLEIHFSAPGFKLPENTFYRCRLKGYERSWNDLGRQRKISYYGIRSGDYQFEVISRNSDGAWNSVATSLAVTLVPYWWETTWFLVGALFVIFALVAVGVLVYLKRRQRRQIERFELSQAMEKERARIAADLHDDMGSSLSQLGLLCERVMMDIDENPADARTYLAKALTDSRVLSEQLDAVVWAVDPANDTVENFIEYLSDYAQKVLAFSDICLLLDVPDEMPSTTLASKARHELLLAIKEALHNVQKHAGAKQVILRIQVVHSQLIVEVEDDGKGVSPDHQRQMGADGLGNMARRMKSLGGCFECLTGKDNHGVRIVFTIPLL